MFILRACLILALTLVVAVLGALNRQDVVLLWNPVDLNAVLSVPLYAVILGGAAIGFLAGGFLVWMNMGPLRKERRHQKREIKLLEKEIDRLKKRAVNDDVIDVEAKRVRGVLPMLSSR